LDTRADISSLQFKPSTVYVLKFLIWTKLTIA